MSKKISIQVISGFYAGNDIKERRLESSSFGLDERETGVRSLKLEYPGESWATPDDPWDRAYLRQRDESARPVKIGIDVSGPRPKEWSGHYTLEYDLSKISRKDILVKILEIVEKGADGADQAAKRERVHQLIEQATVACTSRQYNSAWIHEDSKWTGLCGGRDYYRWFIREEERLLLLFHRHGGIVQGMDGRNTPWACIVAIRFEEKPEGNSFEKLKGLDYPYPVLAATA